MIKKCPKCKKESYIKVPGVRICKESFGILLHIANKHQWKCHNKKCGFKSENVVVKTDLGIWLDLPFWKRIFVKIKRSNT